MKDLTFGKMYNVKWTRARGSRFRLVLTKGTRKQTLATGVKASLLPFKRHAELTIMTSASRKSPAIILQHQCDGAEVCVVKAVGCYPATPEL